MADFEAILARHSQSPYPRGQTFYIFSWREVMGPQLSGSVFIHFNELFMCVKALSIGAIEIF
jgi:hypothetical protein